MLSADADEPRALPPATTELAIGGIVMLELERRLPGLIEACLERASSEAHMANIVRLRGPKVEARTREVLQNAHSWFGVLSVVAQTLPPSKPKRRRKRGRK